MLQTRESSELRAQTEQMGRSLLEWLRNHTTATAAQIELLAELQPTYPLAFALAASATRPRARLPAGLRLWLGREHGAGRHQIGAAGPKRRAAHSVGAGGCNSCAIDHALALPDDARQAFSPMLAILSAQHEVQYSRLFRS